MFWSGTCGRATILLANRTTITEYRADAEPSTNPACSSGGSAADSHLVSVTSASPLPRILLYLPSSLIFSIWTQSSNGTYNHPLLEGWVSGHILLYKHKHCEMETNTVTEGHAASEITHLSLWPCSVLPGHSFLQELISSPKHRCCECLCVW